MPGPWFIVVMVNVAVWPLTIGPFPDLITERSGQFDGDFGIVVAGAAR